MIISNLLLSLLLSSAHADGPEADAMKGREFAREATGSGTVPAPPVLAAQSGAAKALPASTSPERRAPAAVPAPPKEEKSFYRENRGPIWTIIGIAILFMLLPVLTGA